MASNQGGNKGNTPSGSKQAGNRADSQGRARAGSSQSATSNRGFASMDPEKQRAIASEGGRAAHASGNAHEFTSEEARAAGKLSHGGGNRQSGAPDAGARPAGNRGSAAGNQANAAAGKGGNRADAGGMADDAPGRPDGKQR